MSTSTTLSTRVFSSGIVTTFIVTICVRSLFIDVGWPAHVSYRRATITKDSCLRSQVCAAFLLNEKPDCCLENVANLSTCTEKVVLKSKPSSPGFRVDNFGRQMSLPFVVCWCVSHSEALAGQRCTVGAKLAKFVQIFFRL